MIVLVCKNNCDFSVPEAVTQKNGLMTEIEICSQNNDTKKPFSSNHIKNYVSLDCDPLKKTTRFNMLLRIHHSSINLERKQEITIISHDT